MWNEGIIFGGDERKANIEVTLYRIVGYSQESVWCILNYTVLYCTHIVHGLIDSSVIRSIAYRVNWCKEKYKFACVTYVLALVH